VHRLNPKKILVRSPNWIGDQILAYPFFYYLRQEFPHAKIVVACVPWVRSVQFRDLVDDVILLPTPFKPGLWSRLQTLQAASITLKDAGPWDLAITLPHSLSSAWTLFRSGAKVRRGFATDGRGPLLNDKVVWDENEVKLRAESYVKLVPGEKRPLPDIREFWGTPPQNDLDPGIPGVLSTFDADRSWPDAEPINPPRESYFVIAPGSNAESRRWAPSNFANLAKQIQSETNYLAVVVGGAAEGEIAKRLADTPGLKVLNWTARGTPASYWKVFRQAKLTVCNDSGLAHVASLCGSPVQIIWGAGNPKRTEPLGPGKVKIIFNPVDCWPCERNTCSQPPEKKLDCLKGIQPDTVWQEIKSGIRP
jgi:heptosyltransferase II